MGPLNILNFIKNNLPVLLIGEVFIVSVVNNFRVLFFKVCLYDSHYYFLKVR